MNIENFPIKGVERVSYFKVKFKDWENFIRDQFPGCDYDVCFDLKQKIGDVVLLDVTSGLLTKHDEARLTFFKQGNFINWITRLLINDLCNRGVLKPGKILIDFI